MHADVVFRIALSAQTERSEPPSQLARRRRLHSCGCVGRSSAHTASWGAQPSASDHEHDLWRAELFSRSLFSLPAPRLS